MHPKKYALPYTYVRTPKNLPAPTPMSKMHDKLGCFWRPVE